MERRVFVRSPGGKMIGTTVNRSLQHAHHRFQVMSGKIAIGDDPNFARYDAVACEFRRDPSAARAEYGYHNCAPSAKWIVC